LAAAFHDRRARAVAEQHAGIAVLPVHDTAQQLRADDEDRLDAAGGHPLAAATCMPYSQPLHAAPTSKATARDAPSAACNSTAAEGSSRSGEQVPTMI